MKTYRKGRRLIRTAEIVRDIQTAPPDVLERKPFYQLKKEIDDVTAGSEETAGFLDSMEIVFRNMLLESGKGISRYSKDELTGNIYAIEEARRKIKSGISRPYAMKDLLVKIGG